MASHPRLTRPDAPESPSTALRKTPSFPGHTPFGPGKGPSGPSWGAGWGGKGKGTRRPDPGEIAASVYLRVALSASRWSCRLWVRSGSGVVSGIAGGMRRVLLSQLIRLKGGKKTGVWARASSFPLELGCFFGEALAAAGKRAAGRWALQEGTRPNRSELSLNHDGQRRARARGNTFGFRCFSTLCARVHRHTPTHSFPVFQCVPFACSLCLYVYVCEERLGRGMRGGKNNFVGLSGMADRQAQRHPVVQHLGQRFAFLFPCMVDTQTSKSQMKSLHLDRVE